MSARVKYSAEMVARIKAAEPLIRPKFLRAVIGAHANTVTAYKNGRYRAQIKPDPEFRKKLTELILG